jgi:uncharacterized membrane protein YkoI
MPEMKINKTIVIAVLLFGLLMGGLAAGVLLSQQPLDVNAAPPAQEPATEAEDVDQAGDVEDNDGNEAGETEETVPPDQADITAGEAKAAAEAAYPGTKAVEVELERENGVTAYEVGLDNGLEVLINPANGDVLGVDAN